MNKSIYPYSIILASLGVGIIGFILTSIPKSLEQVNNPRIEISPAPTLSESPISPPILTAPQPETAQYPNQQEIPQFPSTETAQPVNKLPIIGSGIPRIETAYSPTSAPISPITKADNGRPFPQKSGYVAGYPRMARNGYSNLTVDNSQNNSNVFVKLFALDRHPPQSVRVFFIRGGEKFTTKNIQAGNYDVRYRDLTSGRLSRTDSFALKEFKRGNRIKFDNMRLTLYRVKGGNMRIEQISDRDF
jgi:hypothetical protein